LLEQQPTAINNTILFIGRIEQYKGIKLLLDSFNEAKKQKKDLKLIIAGSGNILPYMEKIKNHEDSIELVNRWICDNEFEGIIKRSDFLVLPYLDASQSGIIPLAFAFSKPVITTNVGALSEQVPTGTGILVDPEKNQLTKAIIMMYNSPDLIIEYGQNAQKYANSELSWDKSANILLNYIYK